MPWLQEAGLTPAIPVADGGFMGMTGWGMTRAMVAPQFGTPVAVTLWIPTGSQMRGEVVPDLGNEGDQYVQEVRTVLTRRWGEPTHVAALEGQSWSWQLPGVHAQLARPAENDEDEDASLLGALLVGLTRTSDPRG